MQSHSTTDISPGKSFRTIERKLYPTVEQEQVLERYRVECCRLYNRALEQRIKAYERRGETPTLYGQQKWLTKMRSKIESLRSIPVEFSRDALRRLDKGFKAFFRRVKAKSESQGFSALSFMSSISFDGMPNIIQLL